MHLQVQSQVEYQSQIHQLQGKVFGNVLNPQSGDVGGQSEHPIH